MDQFKLEQVERDCKAYITEVKQKKSHWDSESNCNYNPTIHIANEFIDRNTNRKRNFGTFQVCDVQ